MKSKKVVLEEKQTIWTKWECARWTSAHVHEIEGNTCCFSGCNCGTPMRIIGKTPDPIEASNWFKRPNEPKPNPEGGLKGTWYDQLTILK